MGSEEHIGTPIELLRPPLFKLFKSSDFGKGKKAWSILYFQKPSDDGHTLFGLRIVVRGRSQVNFSLIGFVLVPYVQSSEKSFKLKLPQPKVGKSYDYGFSEEKKSL